MAEDGTDWDEENLEPESLSLHGALLTPSQREYLQFGPDQEMSDHSQIMTRSRVRDRLGAAMIDFSIILDSDYLDPDDISNALTEPLDVELNPIPADLIQDAIAVFLVGLLGRSTVDSPADGDRSGSITTLEREIERGVDRGLGRVGFQPGEIDVTIEVEGGEQLDIGEEVNLAELSVPELKRLQLANRISESEFVKAVLAREERKQESSTDSGNEE